MSVQPKFEEGCAFCSIVRGREPAEVVAGGDGWIAFFPLNPATPGHTLVVPTSHFADLWEVDLETGARLMQGCITLGQVLQRILNPDGMNLITSAGRTAEQSVFHLHLHLVPRWSEDDFGKIWPRDGKHERADFGGLADRIRDSYANQEGS